MSTLVTGGAGYIGSATVEALRQRGDAAIVLDNLSAGHRAALPPGVTFYQGDLADRELLLRIMRDHAVEQVVHFAAYTSVPESVARPEKYIQNNVVHTFSLLEAMREAGVRQIVFSSTAAVYGEPLHTPIDESHPTAPTNPYGLTKRFIEQMLESYEAAYGLRHVCLRYFNACGGSPERGEDHQPETHLIPLVLQVALGQREAITIFGEDYPTRDGTCVRDYIHIDDLAQAHLLALDALKQGGPSLKVNLGNGAGYTVREVIEVAREVTGQPIAARTAARRAGDPSALVASARLARVALGWQPRLPDLKSIVASAWQWHRTHPQGFGDRP
jgi:UDP-glucose 4-epimerase